MRTQLKCTLSIVRCLGTAICLLLISISRSSGQEVFRIATGSTQGVYHAFAVVLKAAVEKSVPDIRLDIVPTGGSRENLRLLMADKVNLALVQGDTAYECRQHHPTLRGVASLYTEAAQILVAKASDIVEIDDFRKTNVILGAAGSGTLPNARRILNTLGIYRNQFDEKIATMTDTREELTQGTAAAAFVIAGAPTPSIKAMGPSVQLMGLDGESIDTLLGKYSFFVSTTIPAGLYEGQECEITTVGLRALLVAKEDCPDQLVHEILKLILRDEQIDQFLQKVGEEVNLLDVATKGMPLELHDAAAGHFRYRMLWVRILARWSADIVLLLGVLVFVACVFSSRQRFFQHIRRTVYLRILITFLSVYLVSTVAIHFFERDGNSSFVTLPQSFWSTMVYVLSGIEEKEPATIPGRAFSIILLLTNIGLIGWIVGEFAAALIKHKETRMPIDTKGHIAICNWNVRGDRVVRELHEAQSEAPNIAVLTDSDVDEKSLRKSRYYDTVFFIRSDPQLHDSLESARVHLASSIVILANEESPDPDANSALIALAICKVCDKNGIDPLPHIVAEAVNHRKKAHLYDAGVDEVICPADYGLGVLAQCAVHAKLSDVYDRLLTYSDDTNEIYILDKQRYPERFPAALVGKTFAEASQLLNEQRDPKNPTILIGVKIRRPGKKDGIVLNPQADWDGPAEDKFERIGEDDALIVLSFRPPDLSGIVD